MRDLSTLSIDQIESGYHSGTIRELDVIEELRRRNASAVCPSVLADGAIRTFDPDRSGVFYRHLYHQFGIPGGIDADYDEQFGASSVRA